MALSNPPTPTESAPTALKTMTEATVSKKSGEKSCRPTHPKQLKTLSFSQVEIRQYERILGDNPAVTSGPAVSLAWGHFDGKVLPVDDYESNRPPRRHKMELQLSSVERKSILEQAGFTREDIYSSEQEIKKIQHNRFTSRYAIRGWERAEIIWQSICRKWKRFATRVSQHEKLDSVWENATGESKAGKTIDHEEEMKETEHSLTDELEQEMALEGTENFD